MLKDNHQEGLIKVSSQRMAKKDRPVCAHCGITGHIKDKCFKLHGYPPGYFKNKNQSSSSNMVNQVTTDCESSSQHSTQSGFTTEQMHQLMTYFQTHMTHTPAEGTSCALSVLGISNSLLSKSPSMLSHSWYIDSGATSSIACSLQFYSSHIYL